MRGEFRTAALALVLALAACSREPTKAAVEPEPAAPSRIPAPAVAPPPAARPEGADAVDAALKAAQEYDTAAATELAAVDTAQTRIRTLAGQAAAAAARGDARAVASARSEAERARKSLVDGLAALRTSATAQTAALDAAIALCGATPELSTYEGCAALTAEKTVMAEAIDALAKRYQAAETAYATDRARLEEASATVALGSLR